MGTYGGQATVLFVEDEDLLRDAVAIELEGAGFRVLEASTGEAGMTILHANPGRSDWLFTDIRLPGVIDGWRLGDEFRFTYPLRPVVYATGLMAEKPRNVTDSLFLRKPYRPSEVVRAFETLQAGWISAASESAALERLRTSSLWTITRPLAA